MRTSLRKLLSHAAVALLAATAGIWFGVRMTRPPEGALVAPRGLSQAEADLDRVVPEINLESVRPDAALDALRKATGAKIIVRWPDAGPYAAGPDRQAPVTLQARQVNLSWALSQLIDQIPNGSGLTYAPTPEGILVSTWEEIGRRALLVRAYDVRDLLTPGNAANAGNSPGPAGPDDAQAMIAPLTSMLHSSPYRNDGPFAGSAAYVGGRLLVTQTWDNHRQIAEFLHQLRRAGPAPVRAPARNPGLWDERRKGLFSPEVAAGEAALGQRLAEVRLDAVPLERAFQSLARQAHAFVVPDWPEMERAGWHRDERVTLDLHDVTLGEAVGSVIRSLQPRHTYRLIYGPDWAYVRITPRSAEWRLTVTRLYDVRDLLTSPTPDGSPPPSPKALCDAVALRVDPAYWDASGRDRPAVVNGWLIARQTWETQEKIADFLAVLRSGPAPLRQSVGGADKRNDKNGTR